MTNAERQAKFRAANPGYNRRYRCNLTKAEVEERLAAKRAQYANAASPPAPAPSHVPMLRFAPPKPVEWINDFFYAAA